MNTFNRDVSNIRYIFALLLMFCINTHLYAAEKEQDIIQHAVNAYGGDKLLNMRNLTYQDTLLHFFEHQSGHSMQGAFSQHLNQMNLSIALDFEQQRGELKRTTELLVGYHDKRNITATHRIFNGNEGINVDHFLQSYQASKRISFDNVDLGYSATLDPLIIKKLYLDKKQAKWADMAVIEGEYHDVLTVFKGSQNEYSVYINKTTGFLSRMLQKRVGETRTYNFLNHIKENNIVWARQVFVTNEKSPVYYSENRQLTFNENLTQLFTIPKNYRLSTSDSYFDVSKLTIRELAKGVYFVGQDWGYTFFIELDQYFISAGAWGMGERSDDWKQALALLHKTKGNQKPVKYHLVSHHHTDHMSELHDVLDHGATLLAHSTDFNNIKQFLDGRELKPGKLKMLEDKTELENGKIHVLDIPSSQASHNLAFYLPDFNILFSEDFFGSSFKTAHHSPRSWPHMDTYQRLETLQKALKRRGLHVKQYVSSHHGRVLSEEDITEARKTRLPSNQVIKQRLFNSN